MKLSIVIPNYNYEQYVGLTIESALAIRGAEVEVIVVDDGSTDGSRQVIESFGDRIQAIFQPNSKQIAACNAGFARSTGNMVMFHDSDDLVDPSIGEEIAGVLTPSVSKVQFQMARIDGKGALTGSVFPFFDPLPTPEKIREWAINTNAYPTPPGSGNVYSRHFLEQIFPLDNSCGDFSDSALLTAAPLLGDVVTVAKPLVFYRVHNGNDSNLLSKEGMFAREVARGQSKFVYSQKIGRTVGIDIPDENLRKSLHLMQLRIASVTLDPKRHPIKGDGRLKLLVDSIKATLFFGAMSLKHRLVLLAWGTLTLLSPRPLARKLIRMRFARN